MTCTKWIRLLIKIRKYNVEMSNNSSMFMHNFVQLLKKFDRWWVNLLMDDSIVYENSANNPPCMLFRYVFTCLIFKTYTSKSNYSNNSCSCAISDFFKWQITVIIFKSSKVYFVVEILFCSHFKINELLMIQFEMLKQCVL